MFRPDCGTSNDAPAKSSVNCGKTLPTLTGIESTSMTEVAEKQTGADRALPVTKTVEVHLTPTSEEAFEAFVGDNWMYGYRSVFLKFTTPGAGVASFNVAALFATGIWLIYRKMWVVFIVYWLYETALGMALQHLFTSYLLLISLTLIGTILPAFFANRVYFWHAKKKIKAVIDAHPGAPKDQLLSYISAAGGTTSILIVLVAAILIFVVSIIFPRLT